MPDLPSLPSLGNLNQILRALDSPLNLLLDPLANLAQADDAHNDDRGNRGPDHRNPTYQDAQTGQTQRSSQVYQAQGSATPVADGHGLSDSVVNTLRELPGGVALLNALSRGSDAVPPGIAKQLGEVVQQLTALAQNQSTSNANESRQALNSASNDIVPNGAFRPASVSSQPITANAVPNAAGNSNANAVANQATPNAATQAAVPPAFNSGQALPPGAGLRADIPSAVVQQNAANNVLAFNAAANVPQLAATVAAAQAQQAAQAATQQAAAQQGVLVQGNPAANPTLLPNSGFVNPHAAIPQGSTLGRDGVLPADNRNSLFLQRDAAMQGHTLQGQLRGQNRDVRMLPHRMRRWMAQMGLLRPETLWRDNTMDSEDTHLQQWLFWLLAIIAYGSAGMIVLALLPNGGGLLQDISRPFAGGMGLVLGIAAAAGAWWLRHKMRAKTLIRE